jgi:hypothetical protein
MDAVEVAHPFVDEKLGDVAHDFQAELGREDAGVLAPVFFQNVGLYRCARFRTPFTDLGLGVGRLAVVVGFEFVRFWSMAVSRTWPESTAPGH